MSDDFYAIGMKATPNYFGEKKEESVGGWGSATQAAQEAQLLTSQVKQLTAAINDTKEKEPDKIPRNFLIGWDAFVEQYNAYLKIQQDRVSSLPGQVSAYFTDDIWHAVQNFKMQFAAFASEYEKLTGFRIAPPPIKPPPSRNPDKKGLSLWTIILGGVALLGAGWAGYKLAQEGVHSYKRKLGMR